MTISRSSIPMQISRGPMKKKNAKKKLVKKTKKRKQKGKK
mgnify:CR=1 FL=1